MAAIKASKREDGSMCAKRWLCFSLKEVIAQKKFEVPSVFVIIIIVFGNN